MHGGLATNEVIIQQVVPSYECEVWFRTFQEGKHLLLLLGIPRTRDEDAYGMTSIVEPDADGSLFGVRRDIAMR